MFYKNDVSTKTWHYFPFVRLKGYSCTYVCSVSFHCIHSIVVLVHSTCTHTVFVGFLGNSCNSLLLCLSFFFNPTHNFFLSGGKKAGGGGHARMACGEYTFFVPIRDISKRDTFMSVGAGLK